MENSGVKCEVCECVHNCCTNKCDLAQIEVTNKPSASDAVDTPHFCRSFQKK